MCPFSNNVYYFETTCVESKLKVEIYIYAIGTNN